MTEESEVRKAPKVEAPDAVALLHQAAALIEKRQGPRGKKTYARLAAEARALARRLAELG